MAAQTEVLPPRYERCERIGRGGMGDIYLAHDRQLGRKVAIKVLAERFASDADVRGRFKREALAAARLSGHPHIVTIFDVGEWSDRPHIVMEYLSRGSLADRNRNGRVRAGDALDWLAEAAEALDAAHAAGIVHRDVKPANLLFDDRDELNVADFGIARILDQTTVGMTLPGTVMGTSGYLSPEQADGEQATPASDIYALGVVAFELLTGSRPFERRSATAEAAAHLHDPVPRASDRRAELLDEVDEVFDRVLAKDPAARYASAGEFVADLRAAVEAGEQMTRPVPLPTAPVAPVRPAGPPRRRSFGLGLLAALLLAGGGALAAVLVTGGGGDHKQAIVTRTRRVVETRQITAQGTTVVVPTTVSQTVTQPATAPPPTLAPPPPPTAGATATPPPVITPPATAVTPPAAVGTPSVSEAIRLTDQNKAANDRGDYTTGLRVGRRAVQGLQGSGQIYEAYAYFNYAVSLLRTGNCQQALAYFNRSEAIQGRRSEIDRGRRDARKCTSAGNSDGNGNRNGNGNGNGNGKLKPPGTE